MSLNFSLRTASASLANGYLVYIVVNVNTASESLRQDRAKSHYLHRDFGLLALPILPPL